MDRRNFIVAGLAGLALSRAPSSVAAEAWVQSVNDYLNSVKSAIAPFTQEDSNGKSSSGRFYLQKPGKFRFESDDKNYPLTVADGTSIAVFDNKSNKGPQIYPIGMTPVSLISKSNVDLTQSKFITNITKDGGDALITMADPERPNYGSITVRVRLKDPRIKGWVATSQAGETTKVTFPEFHTGVQMNPDLFSIVKIRNARESK